MVTRQKKLYTHNDTNFVKSVTLKPKKKIDKKLDIASNM